MSFSQKTGLVFKTRTVILGASLLSSLMFTACASPVANNPDSTTQQAPASVPAPYGQAVGSGQKVESPTGTYETITLNKDAPVYTYATHPEYIASAGWTAEDGAAGQRAAVDYMVKEFVDSKALNGGDAAYQEWYKTSAKKYFADSLYQDPAMQSGEGIVVLGNYNGNAMPNLINDGTPREKTLDLEVLGVSAYDDEAGVKGLRYSFNYTSEYRVNDTEATVFASKLTGKSPEEFLNSPVAKDSLKDGKGENVYVAKGQANVVLAKGTKNEWEIIGFQAITEYDTSDFAVQATK